MTLDERFIELIELLHRGGGWGYWWTMPDKKSAWWPINNWDTVPEGKDTYFNVHPLGEIPDRGVPTTATRGKKDEVIGINAFVAEFDLKDYESESELKGHVSNIKPVPSFVVASGGGYHCYWVLDEFLPFEDEQDRADVDRLIKQWVAYVKGDPGAADLARILRVPGTFNYKYEPARLVEVKHPQPGGEIVTYSFARLAKLASGAVKLAKLDEATEVGEAIPEGKRNATLTSLVGSMHRRGMAVDEIYPSIWRTNVNRCKPPLDEDEIQGIIDSVARYPVTLPADEVPIAPPNPKSKHYIDALRALGWGFRLNEMDDTVEVSGAPISDPIRAYIRTQLRDFGYKKVNVAEDAWIAEAYHNRYHPVREYLDGLTWDETDHIWLLSEHFTDINDVFFTWLRRWLIGAVARAYRPGEQNRVLVIDGKQNIGKSYFVRWLASPLPQYHVEGPVDPSNKDSLVRLAGNWIWEIAELGSTIRKADREALKFFISQEVITVRRPYGHEDMRKPALASFIGTVNNESGFLSDPTGSRRFMSTTVTEIDWSYAKEVDIDQVWAQARALFDLGEPHHLDAHEAQQAADINAGYEIDDPTLEYVMAHYVIDPDDQEAFTPTTQILNVLKSDGVRLGSDRSLSMSIGAALRGVGIESCRRDYNGRRQRGYVGVRPRSVKDAS